MLCIEGKNIYLRDNNSKFGTLILVQTPTIKMTENLPLSIQVGRTYLNFELKKDESFFSCCGVSENPNVFYHYKQNEKQVRLNRVWTVKTEKEDNNDYEEDDKENEIKENYKDMISAEVKSKDSDKDESIKIIIENEEN